MKIDSLLSEFGTLAKAVGLGEKFPFGKEAPDGLTVWTSSYAVVAIVNAMGDEKPFSEISSLGVDWVEKYLREQVTKGLFIDGYVLVALPSIPIGDLQALVTEFESSTSICRRQCIWPDAKGDWKASLAKVMILSLPASIDGKTLAPELSLPSDVEKLIEVFGRSSTIAEIVRQFESRAPKIGGSRED